MKKLLFILLVISSFTWASKFINGQVLLNDQGVQVKFRNRDRVHSLEVTQGNKLLRNYTSEDRSSRLVDMERFQLNDGTVLMTSWLRGHSVATVLLLVRNGEISWQEFLSNESVKAKLNEDGTRLKLKLWKSPEAGATEKAVMSEQLWP